jgi:predicted DNA-binding ribbon-helix-helix protein
LPALALASPLLVLTGPPAAVAAECSKLQEINQHQRYPTSVSLEDPFWNALNEIAASRNVRLAELVAMIDRDRQHANLTSVLRLFILDHYRSLAGRRADQPNAS